MTSSEASAGLRSVPRAPWPSRWALKHPRLTLALALALFLAAAPGVARLELATDGANLVPHDAPEVLEAEAVAERFDLRDPIAVVLEADGTGAAATIWRADRLGYLSELSRALAALDGVGVDHVASLATEKSDRVLPGTLDFRPWLEPLPANAADVARLRADVREVGIYAGTLLSRDEATRACAALVGVPLDVDRRAFLRSIQEVLDATRAEREAAGLRLHLAGAPVAEASLGDHLLADLALLIPACVALLALVFFLAFRNALAALLPLCEVGFALVATFGLLGWFGVPLYLSMAVLPVVLCAVGVADEFHVYGAWLRERNRSPERSPSAGASATLAKMARPVTGTSVTTALGFLAFAASPLPPVRAFGLSMVLGIFLCLAWTLCAMPVLLAMLDERLRSGPAPARLERGGARIQRLVTGTLDRPLPVLLLTFLVLVALPLGARRLVVQDSWVGGFAHESEVARSIRRVNELFGGAHLLRVAIDAEEVDAGGLLEPEALEARSLLIPAQLGSSPEALIGCELGLRGAESSADFLRVSIVGATHEAQATRLQLDPATPDPARWIPSSAEAIEWSLVSKGRFSAPPVVLLLADLERYLESFDPEDIARVVGPAEHFETMNFMLGNRRPGTRTLPDSKQRAQLVLDHYRRVRGEHGLASVFEDGASAALLTAFLPSANFQGTAAILDALEHFAAEHLAPHGLSLSLAGDVPRSQAMIAAIVRTELYSLAGGLILVFLAASFFMGSAVLGLCCTLPAAIAVLATFAFMGVAGIPLGVATSMFAAMTIGIGVDYAIHLTSAAQRTPVTDASPRERALAAVHEAGPVILFDALALGAAFGLLLLSAVPTNARLGALMVVSLSTCALVSLGLLPLLLAKRAR